MAKSKRAVQKASTYADPVGHEPVAVEIMCEDLLLMIRARMKVSRRAGMSKVRLALIPYDHAELLVDMLERETRLQQEVRE